MSSLFLKLLNMSITASYLVLGILLLRLLLQKAPKWIFVLLWGFVALRLLLPFSIESNRSLIPTVTPISQEVISSSQNIPYVDLPETYLPEIPSLSGSTGKAILSQETPALIVIETASYIWLSGMLVMASYSAYSYFRLRHSLKEAIPLGEGVWVGDHISTPFLLGFFRPRIYLPSDLAAEDIPLVLCHERAHMRRKDHWWKPLGYILLTVYWFNPILWLAYILLCRDIESACDQRVIRELGAEFKKSYSTALLRCSIPKKRLTACPLAFGEGDLKKRISSILSYKKPSFWILLIALIATIVLSLCFLTDPPAKEPTYEVCWFDLLETDSDGELQKSQVSQQVPGNPDVRLEIRQGILHLHKDGTVTCPFPTRYIFNAFFADLNEDDSPELCLSSFTYGEGYLLPNHSALVYDFVTGEAHDSTIDLPSSGYYFALVEGILTLCKSDTGNGDDWDKGLDFYLQRLRKTPPESYGEPILCWNERTESYVLGRRENGILYPFHLTWEGRLLSQMDDQELAEFLLKSIPDTPRITNDKLQIARSMISTTEKDPKTYYNFYNAGSETQWYLKTYRAAIAYYTEPHANILPFQTEALTMSHVIELSKKGEQLSWEDLYPYKGKDIGSGLYVINFPINDRFNLVCSDTKLTGSPMSAFLSDRETGLSIDIRACDIRSFIDAVPYEKWFGHPDRSALLTTSHPSIEGLSFIFDPQKQSITVMKGNAIVETLQGTAMFDAYFADVTLDGTPDLCCSASMGSGISMGSILIYDPLSGRTQWVTETLIAHYSLWEENGNLLIKRTDYYDEDSEALYDLRAIASGALPKVVDILSLMEKYPEYFGMECKNGLSLYVSQVNEETYACRLAPFDGKKEIENTDLRELPPATMDEIHKILLTYSFEEGNMHLIPVKTAYSSAVYPTAEAYQKAIEAKYLSTNPLSYN